MPTHCPDKTQLDETLPPEAVEQEGPADALWSDTVPEPDARLAAAFREELMQVDRSSPEAWQASVQERLHGLPVKNAQPCLRPVRPHLAVPTHSRNQKQPFATLMR